MVLGPVSLRRLTQLFRLKSMTSCMRKRTLLLVFFSRIIPAICEKYSSMLGVGIFTGLGIFSSVWPTVVRNWHKLSRLSSSVALSSLPMIECMIPPVIIPCLNSSPMKRILPRERRRCRSSSAANSSERRLHASSSSPATSKARACALLCSSVM